MGKFFLVLSDVYTNSWWKIPRGDFTSDKSSTVVQKVFFFFIASKTHTEKKQELHRINKVIKRKNKQKKNRIYTLTWQYTYKY